MNGKQSPGAYIPPKTSAPPQAQRPEQSHQSSYVPPRADSRARPQRSAAKTEKEMTEEILRCQFNESDPAKAAINRPITPGEILELMQAFAQSRGVAIEALDYDFERLELDDPDVDTHLNFFITICFTYDTEKKSHAVKFEPELSKRRRIFTLKTGATKNATDAALNRSTTTAYGSPIKLLSIGGGPTIKPVVEAKVPKNLRIAK